MFDPATGTFAPHGFESWAQFNQYKDAISANTDAMYGYFQQIHAIIDHAQTLLAPAETPDQSETPPENQ